MPCFTQQSSVVELGQKTDVKLLTKALERLGFVVRQNISGGLNFRHKDRYQNGSFDRDGTLNLSGDDVESEEVKNSFKRAYSGEVVRAASARFGWQVKESATNPNAFQVVRRS